MTNSNMMRKIRTVFVKIRKEIQIEYKPIRVSLIVIIMIDLKVIEIIS